ncbi:MAG: cation diffusion facilitator family transporter [Bacteroidales bacterium]
MHETSSKNRGKNLLISIVLNLLITVGQVIGGFLSGSMALLSDALHNFSDVLALVISYIASKLTLRKPHVKYTFGLRRAEIMAAFINSLTLIIIGVLLCFEAIRRFSLPPEIESSWVILFALLSILLNGISVIILHHDSKHNLNVKSAYIHLFTDMITSIGVLAGGGNDVLLPYILD